MAGVLQYQDAPVYVDKDTTSDTVGWQSNWFAYCGTQRIKDGDEAWYRYWHPTDWGTAVAALDRYDDLEDAEDYDETGAWESVAAGSRADHVVGFASRGASGAATATFVPRLTTDGEYEVLVTHGEAANAEEVTWRVAHSGGEDLVTLGQRGGGTGTWDEPRVVTASPYHDDDDLRRSGSLYLFTYSCGDAPDLSGPEMVYRLELSGSAEVTVTLTHDEDLAMDVALLSEVDDDACLAWGDDTVTETVSGTVYVVVDTPVDDDELSYPGAYELTVSYDGSPAGDSAGDPSDAHQWHSLGTYEFVAGKDAAQGAVVLEVADGVAPITDNAVRAAADTVLWLNTDRLPYVWSEEGEDAQIADSVLILKDYALLGIKNAGSWPVRAEPSDDAPVTFRAKRGQRFMAEKNYEGWYEMVSPGLPGEWGYLHEDCCFVHHPLPIEDLDDWYPPWDGDDDDDDDDSAAPSDDDGCDCDAASRPSAGVLGLAVLLATLVAVRRRR